MRQQYSARSAWAVIAVMVLVGGVLLAWSVLWLVHAAPTLRCGP